MPFFRPIPQSDSQESTENKESPVRKSLSIGKLMESEMDNSLIGGAPEEEIRVSPGCYVWAVHYGVYIFEH